MPATVDYISKVTDGPVYLNDQLGCCTISAAGHMEEAWSRYGQGATVEIADADVLKAYEAVAGYVPGRPDTDQGAVMQDVLDYWRRQGIGGHKILAFAEVDIRNPQELAAALYLFGHVYLGITVPASAEQQFDEDKPWDVVRNDGGPLGGHAIDVGYRDGTRWDVVTWGKRQQMTPAFLARYAEEAWVVVSQEWIDGHGDNPAGLDTAQLNADYQALTGKPGPFPVQPTPPAPPTPPDPPTPTPSPSVLDQIIAFLKSLVAEIEALLKQLGG